jgi:biotin carboxylase
MQFDTLSAVWAPDGAVTAPTAVIVDPFSTGADLAPEFRRRGWRAVAVLSSPDLPPLYQDRVQMTDFDDVVVHDGNITVTAAALKAYRPAAVLPGTEIGVEVADAVAEVLGLPGNGTAASRCRRHKGTMARAAAAAGLEVPAHAEVASEADAVKWAEERGATVVKPVDSAGADGIWFCASPTDVATAFRALHGTVNRMGGTNTTVLVQEVMQGQQYFVNTVSRSGLHRVCEIWRDRRQRLAEGVVCDREDLLPAVGNPQDELVSYVCRTLDALEIREGPAHTELMATSQGVMLIECAARMQGTIVPEAVSVALGGNHVTATVDAVIDVERHRALAAQPYELLEHVSVVSLIAPCDGRIAPQGLNGVLSGVTTLHTALGDVAAGAPVARTVDLFTSPGFLYLVSPDPECIEQDYRRIREVEHSGLLYL